MLMQVAHLGELDVRDEGFCRFAVNEMIDPDGLIAGLIKRRVLAWSDDHTVRLITTDAFFIGFTPDGRTLTTGESDLLALWMREQL
jgi:hypothetical protein